MHCNAPKLYLLKVLSNWKVKLPFIDKSICFFNFVALKQGKKMFSYELSP